ncbi:MAG: 4-phosphoerythronate dehydrogenase [Paramuribaculum sp.]|nr:4-phosphoerythronate dehydrogenase [Paramuribaculum sp.]
MDLKIVVERNVPFIADALRKAGVTVTELAAGEIDRAAMADADALVTRTRTRCDASLLEGSRCTLVASATIGLDHVDCEWCRNAGIEVANAPGCNAPGVAQYVISTLVAAFGPELSGRTLGVVGVGHVGSIVARWARQAGMEVLECDPPRQKAEGGDFTDLTTVAARADAITFHVPMTHEGEDATWHLADERFFSLLQKKPLIINTARGAVIDNKALLKALDSGLVGKAAIDCWEGEPEISLELLHKAFVATPHIAGYTRSGKARASQIALEAICRHFGLSGLSIDEPVAPYAPDDLTTQEIAESYDPIADSEPLRRDPGAFETLRNTYVLRPEGGENRVG